MLLFPGKGKIHFQLAQNEKGSRKEKDYAMHTSEDRLLGCVCKSDCRSRDLGLKIKDPPWRVFLRDSNPYLR